MATASKVAEEIIYSRTGVKVSENDQAEEYEDLLEEDLMVNCIEFDQDCFYDLRMLFAEETQNEWTTIFLPEIASVPSDYYTSLKDADRERRKFNLNVETYDPTDDIKLMQQVNKMKEIDHIILNKIFVKTVVLLGSTQDGFYLEKSVPLPGIGTTKTNNSDIDIVFEYGGIGVKEIADETAEKPYLLLEQTKYPGYFKLRICTADSEMVKEPHYFRNTFLKMKLYSQLDFSKIYTSKGDAEESANMASIYGNIENEFGINEVDFVAALKIQAWPMFANEFIFRKRPNGWPSTELVQKVLSEGCGFVPKGMSTSRETEYEWRISFAVQEKLLSRSLSKAQIRAYLFFKTLFKQFLDEPEGLSSYMMKNILFWTVEILEPEAWRDDTVLFCVEALVHMLCAFLDQELIVSYFLPNLNLIANLDTRTIQILKQKAKSLQNNVFQYIVACTSSSEFRGLCDVSLPLLSATFSAEKVQATDYCSLAYFSMYLFLRLQALRYQLTINLEVVKKSQGSSCLFSAVPSRAAWYLIESIKLQIGYPNRCVLLQTIDNTYTLDVSGLRKEVVSFWRGRVYTGMFKKAIEDQEFLRNIKVENIPEFGSFVDWVDMTLRWDSGEHIRLKYLLPNVALD